MDHNIVFNAGDAHPKHDWKHECDHGFRSFHSARPWLFLTTRFENWLRAAPLSAACTTDAVNPCATFSRETDEIFSPERRKSRRRCCDANLTVLPRINCCKDYSAARAGHC